eukprot:TRINITY_DN1452_c0_g1_i21.p2 TRINITY_DN1452_c0_g1~~TRINITY_DN1452_c0_g1_i21.p2  ORF type:complete len:327 (-),score=66.63 TRINITY_DN1452_c0_g1_i21:1985-2965(-)
MLLFLLFFFYVYLLLISSFFFFFLMIRRPPRSTLSSSSAASDVYKRQVSTQSTGNSRRRQMLSLLCGVIAFLAAAHCSAAVVPLQCRDRFLEPFSSSSIWNTAVGSDAQFAAINLFTAGREPSQFHNDQDFFLLATADDPLADWVDQGDWGGDDHCVVTGKVVATVPLPVQWSSASDCDPTGAHCRSVPGQPNNNAMGVLLPDNQTIVQMQPAYRCTPGGPLLARFGNSTDGCPQQFPNVTSVFGDGALGSHGGSGLSGIGGTIRVGELVSANPIRHALKLELQHQWYYGETKLQPDSAYNGGRAQYLWPATGSDGGSNKAPGGLG